MESPRNTNLVVVLKERLRDLIKRKNPRKRNESRELKQQKVEVKVENSKEYKPFLFLLPRKKENMENPNLLIISVFNYGAIEIATNHLKSLQNQGIDNYMAYVTDEESLVELQEKGYHATLFPMEESQKSAQKPLSKGKENFGTKSFDDITYIRYLVIAKLLKEGKTVWYLDVDTVVLSDIRKLILNDLEQQENTSYDMMLQNDINMACSGCMLCFPTAITMHIIENVHMYRNAGFNDQILLNKMLRTYIERNQCKIAYFQNHLFPNGLLYFHAPHANPNFLELQNRFRKYRDEEKGPVAFVHANWMIGIDTKIAELKKHGLWFL